MLKSNKLLAGFALFELLGLTIGMMVMNEFPQPGGESNWGVLLASAVGAALLWWSVSLLIDAVIDRTSPR